MVVQDVLDQAQSPPSGHWLAPEVAAKRLGISDRTLRRHVAQGRYQSRRARGRVQVLVPQATSFEESLTAKLAPDLPSHILMGDSPVSQAISAMLTALDAERERTVRLDQRLRDIEEQRLVLAEQRAALVAEVSWLRQALLHSGDPTATWASSVPATQPVV